MIDTGHVGVPPDNAGKIFDAVPRRTHSLTLASKALREVEVDLAHVESHHNDRTARGLGRPCSNAVHCVDSHYAQAARHFLDHRPPALDEVRQALDCIVRDAYRASDVIYRIRGS